MSLLAVEALSRSFGALRAVDGVGFTVAAGERVALIGPNGAGKSTCFHLINGLLRPDAGRVRLGGRDVTGWRPEALFHAGVGRSFQISATFGSLTVRENLQAALLSARGGLWNPLTRSTRAEAAAAQARLDRLDLGGLADTPCARLSYAERKRAEFALALANEPRLLLMDEPTAGMRPRERGALMAAVSAEVARRGMALLFTEHDMDIVFAHADRVLVMQRGRLIADGRPDAVRADPAVRAAYLGEEA
jgi:branched-chain amino acid transport system ATP-binding protein